MDTELTASNGQKVAALSVFSSALKFFRNHALHEISDQSGTLIVADDVKWVITVPAIWREPAKQFMRIAAYQAGIASTDNPDQLVIALEPEAASIYVRRLHLHQLVPENPMLDRPRTPRSRASVSPDRRRTSTAFQSTCSSMAGELIVSDSNGEFTVTTSSSRQSPSIRWSFSRYEVPVYSELTVADETDTPGSRYMVVDCGGGTVDITVHQLNPPSDRLSELYKAAGGPFGSVGVDLAFEALLVDIFGADFIDAFKLKRPAGWVDLMMAFESRKRAAHPMKTKPLNNCPVEVAVRQYGNREVLWSSQGMLRLLPGAMRRLFQPTLNSIKETIGNILNNPSVKGVKFMFLVGGFSESLMLQLELRNEFKHLVKVIIPTEVSLAILKGAVCFGVDSTTVTTRRSRATYAIGGFVRPFVAGSDPEAKRVRGDGSSETDWCADSLDVLVVADQPVCLGETVVRRYVPASSSSSDGGASTVVLDIYRSDRTDIRYTTDKGVKRCGTLTMDLESDARSTTEIQIQTTFGGTEVKVAAIDASSGKKQVVRVDFLSK